MQGLFQREVMHKKQSGSVFIISLLMTSLFLAIGMTIVRVNAIDHKASTEIAYSNVAYQQSEIAMEFALNQIYNPIGSDKTFQGYLKDANLGRNFTCENGFVQLDSGDAYFKIAIYNRSATPVQLNDCNKKFLVSLPTTNGLRSEIGKVKVWGYYRGTIRSVESEIIEIETPTP